MQKQGFSLVTRLFFGA